MTAHAAPAARPELTLRRWAVWSTVLVGACAAISLAGEALAASPPSSDRIAGCLVLFALALCGEHFPVPTTAGAMSLSAVPIACAAVMYGAAVAAPVAAGAHLLEALLRREHPLRIVFNASVFALMGGAAGLAAHVHPRSAAGLIVAAILAATAQYLVNVGLVTIMIVQARIRECGALLWSMTKALAMPFALSTALVPLFVVAWRNSPYVAFTALVPLVGVGMLMRSLEASRQATALALTDPLTGLGNRRSLTERLDRDLERAGRVGLPLSVCVLDVDDFKRINDTRGHEAGDEALVAVATVLRRDGEAFRLGGDEFVLVLPGHDASAAEGVADAVSERVRDLGFSVSAGVATYGGDGVGRNDLLRRADEQLYEARATRR